MFDVLSTHFHKIQKTLRGQARIRESNIADALRATRMALLEADVSLAIVKELVEKIKAHAIGQDVLHSLTPSQAFIGIVHEELTCILGEVDNELNLATQPPAVLLLVGLQGSGKTTSSAKLAYHLQTEKNKKTLLVGCDVYRPAASEQLRILAKEAGLAYYETDITQTPEAIATQAIEYGRRHAFDVIIIDTAGRVSVNQDMMDELTRIQAMAQPIERLLVCDAMLGQDALAMANAFQKALPITGLIVTKLDGDARGGALLSVWHTLRIPVKFCGISEKMDGLERFQAKKIASRILGMMDIVSLVEESKRESQEQQANEATRAIRKGRKFDLTDFRQQVTQVSQFSEKSALLGKLPAHFQQDVADGTIRQQMLRMQGIIDAMTAEERMFPDTIRASRKRRIARGAGVAIQDVNRLLNQFTETQRVIKQLGKGGSIQRLLGAMGSKVPFSS